MPTFAVSAVNTRKPLYTTYFLPIPLSPSENSFTILTAHESVDFFPLQASGLAGISKAITIIEVDAMLVQQLPALLFIIYKVQ